MLMHLQIRDFAIIDAIELEFNPGLTVLTGETGAGKSIIVDALQLLAGGRAGAESVIEGKQSRVWDEAENRLHVQKAIMAVLMGGEKV